jgi:hypothetical protein
VLEPREIRVVVNRGGGCQRLELLQQAQQELDQGTPPFDQSEFEVGAGWIACLKGAVDEGEIMPLYLGAASSAPVKHVTLNPVFIQEAKVTTR